MSKQPLIVTEPDGSLWLSVTAEEAEFIRNLGACWEILPSDDPPPDERCEYDPTLPKRNLGRCSVCNFPLGSDSGSIGDKCSLHKMR